MVKIELQMDKQTIRVVCSALGALQEHSSAPRALQVACRDPSSWQVVCRGGFTWYKYNFCHFICTWTNLTISFQKNAKWAENSKALGGWLLCPRIHELKLNHTCPFLRSNHQWCHLPTVYSTVHETTTSSAAAESEFTVCPRTTSLQSHAHPGWCTVPRPSHSLCANLPNANTWGIIVKVARL